MYKVMAIIRLVPRNVHEGVLQNIMYFNQFVQVKEMKGIKLIFMLFLFIWSVPSWAVSMCLEMTSATSCTSPSVATGQPDWTITCSGITIRGVGVCSSSSTRVASNPTVSSSSYYCWCKMIYPAISDFVRMTSTSWGQFDWCEAACAQRCAQLFYNNSTFKNNILKTLQR